MQEDQNNPLQPPTETREAGGVAEALTYEVIAAAQKVHGKLGPGFAESTYQAALSKELAPRKIAFDTQQEFQVFYEGELCGTYRPDIVVGNTTVPELKAVSALAKEHTCQTLSYLRASSLPVGLLLNFGSPSLEVRRFQHNCQNPLIPLSEMPLS